MEKINQTNHKITSSEQLYYIYITLKETINILGSHITNAALSKFRRFTL